jgi:hypothetical protein
MHRDCVCVSNIYFKQENFKKFASRQLPKLRGTPGRTGGIFFENLRISQKGQKTVLPGRR